MTGLSAAFFGPVIDPGFGRSSMVPRWTPREARLTGLIDEAKLSARRHLAAEAIASLRAKQVIRAEKASP